MRDALLVALLSSLILAPSAFAEEELHREIAVRMVRLAKAKSNYEVMLRDPKTETAAAYFVERIERIEDELKELEPFVVPAPARSGARPAPPLADRADRWLRARIRLRVSEADAGLSDVVAWTRRELPEAFFDAAELWPAQRTLGADAESRSVWERRERGTWHSASFGSGTFIVRPSQANKPSDALRASLALGKTSHMKGLVPRPPTRDQWWDRASARERTEWVLASFVEHSGLFEVADLEPVTRCPVCDGAGLESKTLSSGETITYRCTRCAGTKQDVTLRYR